MTSRFRDAWLVEYMCQWTPASGASFFKWKYSRLKQRLERSRGGVPSGWVWWMWATGGSFPGFSRIERKVGNAHSPARSIKYMTSGHLMTGRCIQRSPGHPLWCSYEEDYGWSDLAKVVTVTIVPARMKKILEERVWKTVARHLAKLSSCRCHPQPADRIVAGGAAARNGHGSRPDATRRRARWAQRFQQAPAHSRFSSLEQSESLAKHRGER